jgi:hypothetical protein
MFRELMHRERRRHEHAHLPARLRSRSARERLGLVDVDQDRPRALQIALADLGQRDSPRRAVEQPRAEVRLEVGDRPRDDRRREVQRPRRLREAALVDDPDEDLHRTQQVHSFFLMQEESIVTQLLCSDCSNARVWRRWLAAAPRAMRRLCL